jgi:hypothetical protein
LGIWDSKNLEKKNCLLPKAKRTKPKRSGRKVNHTPWKRKKKKTREQPSE